MKLKMLGTGYAQVTRCYNTCLTLTSGEGMLLVDAGGGNQILSILEEEGIDLYSIHDIFVTHAHTDHIFGVIWVIRLIGEAMAKGKYEGSLTVYGHKELLEAIEFMCRATLTKKVLKNFGERIILLSHEDGDARTIIGARVTVFDILSTKMKQFGFVMEYDGKVLVDAGDEPLAEERKSLAKNADWLFHEAFCLYSDRDIFKPYEKNHSTARDAAMLAQELGVKNLVLYHTEDKSLSTRKVAYTAEAKAEYSGNVFVPDDREEIEL